MSTEEKWLLRTTLALYVLSIIFVGLMLVDQYFQIFCK